MLAWLNAVLSAAKITDNKLDTEALNAAIEAELPKHTAPKTDYEQALKERDSAQAQLNNVKGADIVKLQGELAAEKAGRVKERQEQTLRTALSKAGANDVDYLLYKLGDLEKLFDKEGKIKEEESFIKTTKESYSALFGGKGQAREYGTEPPPAGGNLNTGSLEDLDMKAYIKARNGVE